MKIYIDENFPPQLASGIHILEQPNGEGIEVLSIKQEFGQGAADEDWIPKVGKLGGIVLTQDLNIQRTRHQKELYLNSGLGIFFFKGPSNKGFKYWEMVEHIVKNWVELKKLSKKTNKPFAYRYTSRGGFKPLD